MQHDIFAYDHHFNSSLEGFVSSNYSGQESQPFFSDGSGSLQCYPLVQDINYQTGFNGSAVASPYPPFNNQHNYCQLGLYPSQFPPDAYSQSPQPQYQPCQQNYQPTALPHAIYGQQTPLAAMGIPSLSVAPAQTQIAHPVLSTNRWAMGEGNLAPDAAQSLLFNGCEGYPVAENTFQPLPQLPLSSEPSPLSSPSEDESSLPAYFVPHQEIDVSKLEEEFSLLIEKFDSPGNDGLPDPRLVSPFRPSKSRGPQQKAKHKEYVPRAQNPFIMFSNAAKDQGKLPKELGNSGEKAKAVSQLWKSLTPAQRGPWMRLGKFSRDAHKVLHPDYKFRPNQKKSAGIQKTTRASQKKAAGRAVKKSDESLYAVVGTVTPSRTNPRREARPLNLHDP